MRQPVDNFEFWADHDLEGFASFLFGDLERKAHEDTVAADMLGDPEAAGGVLAMTEEGYERARQRLLGRADKLFRDIQVAKLEYGDDHAGSMGRIFFRMLLQDAVALRVRAERDGVFDEPVC